jgi:DNA (cytosine-5)-methyltransferase 3A
MQPINVLSLFDGCSGGNQALEMSGIKVSNYYACEIDKYAIQVTQSNYPNTIQLGDVTKVNVKTIYLSEVYSYICNKYINNELYSLQSYISEQEMLHRINEEQAFSAYFGTQEQGKNSEVSTNTLLSINDRIWFWKYPMGGDKGVYDIIRSGSRRKVTNKIDVGVLCEYSFWWNGNGQYQSRIKEESFFGSNRIEKIGNNKTEDSRSSNKTIFNSSIERKSEIVSNRIIQRPIKKTKLFEWDGKCKHGAEVDKKEGNGRAKKASSICQNEGNIQANYEVNGVIEIDRVLVSIYSDVQVTIIECEWGIVIFKGVLELCCGGSPCQSFSFAGKRKGMSTKDETEILTLEHYLQLKSEGFEFEGQSYLFWEYMRLLNELRVAKPDVKFLLENVEMGEKWEKVLSKAIGVNGIHINSALLTAQNRKRIYWTNIGMVQSGLFGDLESIIQQPKDKKIVLKDILENEVNEKYFLSEQRIETMLKSERSVPYVDEETKKFNCLLAGYNKIPTDGQYVVHNTMPRSSTNGKGGTGHLSRNDGKTYCLDTGNTNAVEIKCVAMRGRGEENKQQLEPRNDNKTNCLTSVQKDNLILGCDYRSDEGLRFREGGKTGTLAARARNDESCGQLASIKSRIRRLTPLECERLQGMADNYTKHVSDSQRYKMIGNGWTIPVISHLFNYIK